jgi:hypothetical protein
MTGKNGFIRKHSAESHGPARRDRFRLSKLDKIYLGVGGLGLPVKLTAAFIESVVVTALVLTAFILLHVRFSKRPPAHLAATCWTGQPTSP